MTNVTPQQYVDQLRSWSGVRFRHQGRNRQGVDCVGLVIMAAAELGIANGADRITGYSRSPNKQDFDYWSAKFYTKLPYNRLQPVERQVQIGDLLTFWIDVEHIPRHIAVFTGFDGQNRPTMIHSHAKTNRGVLEMPIDTKYWSRRVSNIYRLPAFQDN